MVYQDDSYEQQNSCAEPGLIFPDPTPYPTSTPKPSIVPTAAPSSMPSVTPIPTTPYPSPVRLKRVEVFMKYSALQKTLPVKPG